MGPTGTSTPTTSPGPEPGTTPADGASPWRIVVPPLPVPAAYLDFGFAGNGDLIVVATDDITDAKLGLWVARYRPDGTRVSKHAIDRKITRYAGDWIDVDPTDDTVLFSERDAGTTTYTGRRVSSATGVTIGSIDFHGDVRRVAIDDAGRIWAITPYYSGSSSVRACFIDRLRAGGGIATGVDRYLEECGVRGYSPGLGVFGLPIAIELGRDGRLLLLDSADATYRRQASGTGLALTVLTTSFELVRQWPVPLEWGPTDAPYATWSQSMTLAASSDGWVYLGEVLFSDDATHSVGLRVRAFDRAGVLMTTYGTGGDQLGVAQPSSPNVDARDRLWVIDLDASIRSYTIKVLE